MGQRRKWLTGREGVHPYSQTSPLLCKNQENEFLLVIQLVEVGPVSLYWARPTIAQYELWQAT